MPKRARRYEIYLPLEDNAGEPIPEKRLISVEQTLIDRFGGFTTQYRAYPLRGMWQADSRTYLDNIVIYAVLDSHRGGSTAFIRQLKKSLLRDFDQLEILITEAPLRVH